jgi:hypothetical protein
VSFREFCVSKCHSSENQFFICRLKQSTNGTSLSVELVKGTGTRHAVPVV